MRGVFHEDFDEVDRPRSQRDTEFTLGSGTLFALFLGLVLLCGLCFGMGYSLGHHSSGPTATAQPRSAPDQEPLQGNGGIPKPSAVSQAPDAAIQPPAADQTAPAADATSGAAPAQSGTPATETAQPQVRPALGPVEVPQAAPAVAAQQAIHPAMVQQPAMPQQQLMVQVAAVSNPEDADVLVGALRKRGYPVIPRREPGDNLIHVRIGPFATRQIADQWRSKLLSDGYNAVVQQ